MSSGGYGSWYTAWSLGGEPACPNAEPGLGIPMYKKKSLPKRERYRIISAFEGRGRREEEKEDNFSFRGYLRSWFVTRAHTSSLRDKTKTWTLWTRICTKHKSLHPRQGPQAPRPSWGLLWVSAAHGAPSSSKPCTGTSSLLCLFTRYCGTRDHFCFKFQNDWFCFTRCEHQVPRTASLWGQSFPNGAQSHS